jgi:hypothetical protein
MEAAREEVRATLLHCAREGSTITYGELALCVSGMDLGPRSPLLHSLLKEACREEAGHDRPMLGSVVVRKSDGLPGDGYFRVAETLGHDVSDKRAFWRDEFERCHRHWSRNG